MINGDFETIFTITKQLTLNNITAKMQSSNLSVYMQAKTLLSNTCVWRTANFKVGNNLWNTGHQSLIFHNHVFD